MGGEADQTILENKVNTEHYKNGVSVHYATDTPNPHNPELTIPRLRMGSAAELRAATDTFAYKSEYGTKETGLQEFIRTENGPGNTPVYIVDNHNHALFGWMEALREGRIKPGCTLLHIDNHGDDFTTQVTPPNPVSLEEVAQTTRRLEIYDFIDLAQKSGLVSRVIWVGPIEPADAGYDLPANSSFISKRIAGLDSEEVAQVINGGVPPDQLIVDVDLDFFAPHIDDPEFVLKERGSDQKIAELALHDEGVIKKAIDAAGVVTMATSPHFMDQTQAIQLAQQILAKP